MTPIEAAVKAGIECGFDGELVDMFTPDDARAIITAFLEAAAEDEGVRLKVECAMSGRHWSESARLGILALKEAINGP